MSDIIYIGAAIAAVVVMTLFFSAVIIDHDKQYERFMQQCLHDHKQYECKALWDGNGASIVIIRR